ncbi:NAD(P)-dependent oxidoreductase [Paenibacillus sp. GYB004]|uniref:NAD-dependent epimerase/dehydratase family protein n=1 Tax=Paenibacillus sp. GYB004 TaxID=2994393 RepID=UPI002F967E97
MKVLLTGATGFLGSHILKHLIEHKHNVTILKRSFSDTNRIYNYLNSIDCYNLDEVELEEIFNNVHYDAIIHTATDYGRQSSISDTVHANVVFPLRLLELFERNSGKVFINTDSFFNRPGIIEEYTYLSSYTSSKRYFLEMATSFILQKQTVKLFNMRLEHIYGPYDSETKFVDNILQSLINGTPFIDMTLGEQRRDFVYVSDVVEAFSIVLCNFDKATDLISNHQVGQGKNYSIKQFVLMAKEITNSKSDLIFGAIPYRENEIMSSIADVKSLSKLGWKSQVDLYEGIHLIVQHMINKRIKV